METGIYKAVSSMTDIDDSLILEAAEIKRPDKNISKRTVFKYAAAAAAAVVIAAGVTFAVSRFNRDPGGQSAFLPPEEAKTPTEFAYTPKPDVTYEPGAPAVTDTQYTVTEPTPRATSPGGSGGSQPQTTDAPMPTSSAEPSSAPTSEPSPSYGSGGAGGQPVATSGPEQTEEYEPPTLGFAGVEEFLSAVRGGENELLYGIDCYYTPAPAADAELIAIIVQMYTVQYCYSLAGGSSLELVWFRDEGQSGRQFDYFLSIFEGEWHGDIYLVRSAAGIMHGYKLDNGHLLHMYGSGITSVERALECYAPVRHGI